MTATATASTSDLHPTHQYYYRLQDLPDKLSEGYWVGSTGGKVPISPKTGRGWRHGKDRTVERSLDDAGTLENAFACVGGRARIGGPTSDAGTAELFVSVPLISKVLTPDDDWVVIDIDKCISPLTGKIEPWAEEIVGLFPHAYWELSTSGTGLHGWVHAPGMCQVGRSGKCYFKDFSGRVRSLEIFFGEWLKPIPVTGQRFRHGWSVGPETELFKDHSREIFRHFSPTRPSRRQHRKQRAKASGEADRRPPSGPRNDFEASDELRQRFQDLLSLWTWQLSGDAGHAWCHNDPTPSLVIWPHTAACWCRHCDEWWGFWQLAQEWAGLTDDECAELAARPGSPGGLGQVKELRSAAQKELRRGFPGGGEGRLSGYFRRDIDSQKYPDIGADRKVWDEAETQTKGWAKENTDHHPDRQCGIRTVGRLTEKKTGRIQLKFDSRVCGKMSCPHCSYYRKAEIAVHFSRLWKKCRHVYAEIIDSEYLSESRKRWLRRQKISYYWFKIVDKEGRLAIFTDKPLSDRSRELDPDNQEFSNSGRISCLIRALAKIREGARKEKLIGGCNAWAPPRRGDIAREIYPDRFPPDVPAANEDNWYYSFEGTTKRPLNEIVNYFGERGYRVELPEWSEYEGLDGRTQYHGVRIHLGVVAEEIVRDAHVAFDVRLPPKRYKMNDVKPGRIRLRRDVE